MRMSFQNQYMLDMEKEKSQTALFKCYDFRGGQSLTEVSRTIRYLEAENPLISL